MMKPLTAQERSALLVRKPSLFVQLVKALVPIVLIAAAFAGFVTLRDSKPIVAARSPTERIWPVKAVEAEIVRHRPTIVQFGTLAPARTVDLRALVAGEVVEVGPGLVEGALVEAGDMLLRIDPFVYRAARDEAAASLAEARARLTEYRARIDLERAMLVRGREQLELAQRDLERAQDLVDRGTISDKTVEDRSLVVSQRQEGVEVRLNNLEIEAARSDQQTAAIERLEWAVRRAERDLERTGLVAPFDAIVGDVAAERGRYLGLNDPVATLTDRGAMDARFTLSDAEFGRIAADGDGIVGREVEVVWQAGDVRLERRAVIERVAPSITTDTGGIEVYARFSTAGADGRARGGGVWRPGAFVEIRIPDRAYDDVVRLPETAIYAGDTVYAIAEDRLQARSVEIVGADGVGVLVRGPIAPGEPIVTSRFSEAGNGVKVAVQ